MLKLKGKFKSLTPTFEKTQLITFEITEDIKYCVEEIQNKELDIEVKVHRNKRSLQANALLWELCTSIGNKLRTSKEEVYIEMLRRYGQSAVVTLSEEVNASEFFKYCDEVSRGTSKGKRFVAYKVYKGSSEYNTEEMSILLDGVVSEAKELGIQVLSASELDLIKNDWRC